VAPLDLLSFSLRQSRTARGAQSESEARANPHNNRPGHIITIIGSAECRLGCLTTPGIYRTCLHMGHVYGRPLAVHVAVHMPMHIPWN
jgi:hypothetical protein